MKLMLRIVFLVISLAGCASPLCAQLLTQLDTTIYSTTKMIPTDRADLLKRMDLIFNIQYANFNNFTNGKYSNTAYALKQFRLEVVGEVFDSVYFRFRDRYTRDPIPQTVDNTNLSVDMALVEIRFSRKFGVTFGKMKTDYGGYEFDLNPIYIYQYNDLNAHFDDWEVGASVAWKITRTQRVSFQLLNAQTGTFAQAYDSIPGVRLSKFPFISVANWRGNFANSRFNTCYSLSMIQEARNEYVYYLALGNQLNLRRWLMEFDFKVNSENIDRSGIVSGFVPETYMPYRALNTTYIERWLHIKYSFVPNWWAVLTAYSNDAFWSGNPDPNRHDHLRTSYGLIPALEFNPYKKLSLKFFAAYVGRYYNYTGYARKALGIANSTTGIFEIGLMAPLVVL